MFSGHLITIMEDSFGQCIFTCCRTLFPAPYYPPPIWSVLCPSSLTRKKFLGVNWSKHRPRSEPAIGLHLVCKRAEEGKKPGPNDQIRVASIGIGGKGASDARFAAKFGKTVAICDIDEKRLAGTKRDPLFEDAAVYTDYRKLFDEMGDKIDAVTVSTPDHNHAAASLMAMRLGKHVYCQKPLTRTIYESRLVGQVARDTGVATQMGNQGSAETELRRRAALLKAGALGKVSEVHVWTNRPIWPQGGKAQQPCPCPEHIKWEEWIGPAKFRPYAKGYHPFVWRGYWDFGTGALGDIASPHIEHGLCRTGFAQPDFGSSGNFWP